MKKALAAILASFVGLFGYQIVDKAIEARVDNLEYQVSSQQEEIESLHKIGKYSNSEYNDPYTENSVNANSETQATFSLDSSHEGDDDNHNTNDNNNNYSDSYPSIGGVQEYTGQKKYMFRLYESGWFRYISPGSSPLENNIQVSSTEPTTSDNTYAETRPAGARDDGIYYIDDYYLTITSASRTILGIEDATEKYYDNNYSVQSRVTGSVYTVKYHIEGHTDQALAGKKLRVFPSDDEYDYKSNNPAYYLPLIIIKEDGSFELDAQMCQWYVKRQFSELYLSIYQ